MTYGFRAGRDIKLSVDDVTIIITISRDTATPLTNIIIFYHLNF